LKEQHDEAKCNEGAKREIKFVVAGGNAAEVLEVMDEPFNLVALFVELLVVPPGRPHVRLGWHNGDTSFGSDGFSYQGVAVSFVHHDSGLPWQWRVLEEPPSLGRIVRIARAQGKGNAGMSACNDHVDLRRQTATGTTE
jgi:hypothetical protein